MDWGRLNHKDHSPRVGGISVLQPLLFRPPARIPASPAAFLTRPLPRPDPPTPFHLPLGSVAVSMAASYVPLPLLRSPIATDLQRGGLNDGSAECGIRCGIRSRNCGRTTPGRNPLARRAPPSPRATFLVYSAPLYPIRSFRILPLSHRPLYNPHLRGATCFYFFNASPSALAPHSLLRRTPSIWRSCPS